MDRYLSEDDMWAHNRRNFFEARSNDAQLADYALEMIQKIYLIERQARDQRLTGDERKKLRQKQALPILQRFEEWLKD